MLEQRKFETRTNELKVAAGKKRGAIRWRRSDRDRTTGSVNVAGIEQGNGAFVIGAAGRVDPLVQLREGGENQREQKQADKSSGHDRDRPAVAKMPLHLRASLRGADRDRKQELTAVSAR